MIDQTIQMKSLMDSMKAMNEAIITNLIIINRHHLPNRPISRPPPETEIVIDFLLKTSQWMIINWNTTMITNQMSWICFLIFQIRKSLKKDHLEEVSSIKRHCSTQCARKVKKSSPNKSNKSISRIFFWTNSIFAISKMA